ncbi:hypothetical protein Misp06_02741 [Microbulbifer sp. NBRC 101763]|uniref:sensor histidine kinase n=1 Tax=unclassified Microbulbifer TaxID=2619833 RepID=UPI0030B42958
MKFLKSPTPTAKFLTYHFGGWLIFALVNTFSLGLLTQHNFEKNAIQVATVVISLGLSTLFIREIIYRFDLINTSWRKQWIYFLTTSIPLGFICAFIAIGFVYAYYIHAGYAVPPSFWGTVLDNWLFLVLLMIAWTFIYITTVNKDRLHKAEQEAIQLKLQLNEVKMSALMGQLNPHFLFNGLNNIRALILEDAAKSREMLTNLSGLLRYTLVAHKQKTVPLRDELEIVSQYAELLKIQYEDRLRFNLEVDPALMEESIPPLLIQLLAENAVRHGIDKSRMGGELLIKIFKEKDHISITVTNPGTLENLNSEVTTPGERKVQNTGLGLINIKKRLSLQYGNRASFNLQQQGLLVVAQCSIPSSAF